MSAENKISTSSSNQFLLDNLNNFIIKIDYYDPKGKKKNKNKIPLKYILNSRSINNQVTI